jgi:HK97 family phage portal protein
MGIIRRVIDAVVGRKASGASTVYVFNSTAARGPSWDMSAEIREGLQSNSVVYACISKITTQFKAVPWVLFRKGSRGTKTEIDEHPILELLNRPNEYQGYPSFATDLMYYLEACGNSVIYAGRVGKNPPRELLILRPDRLSVKPDEKGLPQSYTWRNDAGRDEPYTREQLLHLKLFRVESEPLFGLSPIRVGAYLVDQDNFAIKWNRNLLANNGQPSTVFAFKEGLDPQQQEYFDDFIKNKFAGPENAGKPLRLSGDVTITKLGSTPSEMDWTNSTVLNNRRICQLFGVPAELIGDPASKTYSNQQEARLALVEEVVFPLMDQIASEWNAWLVPMYGDDSLFLAYDKDAVDVVAQKRKVAYERVQTADWLSINEQRVETGWEEWPEEDADIPRALLQQRGMLEALSLDEEGESEEESEEEPEEGEEEDTEGEEGEAEDAEAEEPAEEPEEPEEESEDEKAVKAVLGRLRARAKARKLVVGNKYFNLASEEQKAAAWQQVERQRRAFEQFFAIQLQKHFREERRKVSAAIKGRPKDDMLSAARGVLAAGEDKIEGLLKTLYTTVGRFFYDQARHAIVNDKAPVKSADPLDKIAFAVQRRLERKAAADVLGKMRAFFSALAPKRAEQLRETTEDKVARILEEGILGGKTDEEIATKIEDLYDEQFVAHRAEMISSTEVVGTSNYGANQGAKSTGINLMKQWLTQRDDRVREMHQFAEGQTVPIDDPFVVGGEKLMWPGDTEHGASLENVVNCRCSQSYVEATQEE